MPKFSFVVMSNPVAGREEEYHAWYLTHISQVLQVPGVVSCQWHRRTEAQRNQDQPYAYFALYQCEADSPQPIIDELKRRGGTSLMPTTTAMEDVRFGCYFEPITEVLTSGT